MRTKRHDSGFLRWVASAVVVTVLACGCENESEDDPGEQFVYAAIGASDAVGIGALPLTSGYVHLIAGNLGGTGLDVRLVNLGMNGAKADDFLIYELPQAIAVDPDLITVWAGGNDLVGGRTPEEFGDQLDMLLRALKANTHAQVFVADLPDLTQAPEFQAEPSPDVTRDRIEEFNARIWAAVAANGCVLVRLSDFALDPSMFAIDGFHPSNAGHQGIADSFWSEIEPRL